MIRYAITDRCSLTATSTEQTHGLVVQAQRLASAGVDYLQLREKDLSPPALRTLALQLRDVLAPTATRLILNGPEEIARELNLLWHADGSAPSHAPAFSASCHSLAGIRARRGTTQLLLFGPVFGKTVQGIKVQPPVGLAALRAAVQSAAGTPVLALGGVTVANLDACLQAGAAGMAGIRYFQPHRF